MLVEKYETIIDKLDSNRIQWITLSCFSDMIKTFDRITTVDYILLNTAEMKILRNITGCSLVDGRRNEEIRETCEAQDVLRRIRQRKREWDKPYDKNWGNKIVKITGNNKTNTRRLSERPAKKKDILVPRKARFLREEADCYKHIIHKNKKKGRKKRKKIFVHNYEYFWQHYVFIKYKYFKTFNPILYVNEL